MGVFKSYLSSMKWIPGILVVLFFVTDQGCAMAANVWLSKWSDDVNSFNVTAKRDMYLGVYAMFGMLQGKLNSQSALRRLVCGIHKVFNSFIIQNFYIVSS